MKYDRGDGVTLTDSVRTLKGVGDKIEKNLNKLGIFTVEDLLEYYPRTYQTYDEPVDVSDVTPGKRLAVKGYLHRSLVRIPGGRVEKTAGTLIDGDTRLQLIWYRMPYLKKQIISGKTYIFYGIVKNKNGQWTMEQPEIFEPEAYSKVRSSIQPVYSLTEGVHQKMIGKLVR